MMDYKALLHSLYRHESSQQKHGKEKTVLVPWLEDHFDECYRAAYFGFVINLSPTISLASIKEALYILHQRHELLRARRRYGSHVHGWMIEATPPDSFPVLDLRTADPASIQALYHDALPRYYEYSQDFRDRCCRILIVQEPTQTKVSFLLNESIRDQMSEDVLRQDFFQIFNKSYPPAPALYEAFIDTVMRGPLISPDEWNELFPMKEILYLQQQQSASEQQAPPLHYYSQSLSVGNVLNPIEQGIGLIENMLSHILRPATYIVWFNHDCRSFHHYQFSSTLGDFNDHLPFIFGKANKPTPFGTIRKTLQAHAANDLHIMRFFFDPHIPAKWRPMQDVFQKIAGDLQKNSHTILARITNGYTQTSDIEILTHPQNEDYIPRWLSGLYLHLNYVGTECEVTLHSPIEIKSTFWDAFEIAE